MIKINRKLKNKTKGKKFLNLEILLKFLNNFNFMKI